MMTTEEYNDKPTGSNDGRTTQMTDLIPRDAAIACLTDEADRCDDAVKWGGSRRYVQDCKAAAYAMRSRVPVLQAIPAIDPAAIREAALKEAAGLIADMSRIITHTDEDLGTLTGRNLIDPRKAAAAILALIGEKK